MTQPARFTVRLPDAQAGGSAERVQYALDHLEETLSEDYQAWLAGAYARLPNLQARFEAHCRDLWHTTQLGCRGGDQ